MLRFIGVEGLWGRRSSGEGKATIVAQAGETVREWRKDRAGMGAVEIKV